MSGGLDVFVVCQVAPNCATSRCAGSAKSRSFGITHAVVLQTVEIEALIASKLMKSTTAEARRRVRAVETRARKLLKAGAFVSGGRLEVALQPERK